MKPIKRLYQAVLDSVILAVKFLQLTGVRFIRDDCILRSAALTFTTALSIVPLVLVGFSFSQAFPGLIEATRMQGFIQEHFVGQTGAVIQEYISEFVSKAQKLPLGGIIALFFTAVWTVKTLEGTFNAIWRVKESRKWLLSLLLYWAILTLVPVLISVISVMTSHLQMVISTSSQTEVLGIVFPYLLSSLAFGVFYVAMPNCSVRFRHGFIAGVLVTFLIYLMRAVLGWYLDEFGSYQVIYGVLATIPLFLLWVYILWIIILLGAELSYMLMYGHGFTSKHKLGGFSHAWCWLVYCYNAQRIGQGLTLEELIHLDKHDYEVSPAVQLQELLSAKLIRMTDQGDYILARPLMDMTLYDVYQSLPWQLPEVSELEKLNISECQGLLESIVTIKKGAEPELMKPIREFF